MRDFLKGLAVGALIALLSGALGFWIGARINAGGNIEFVLGLLAQEQARHRATIEQANTVIAQLNEDSTPPPQ